MIIKYNYTRLEIPQVPNLLGKYNLESYFKYDMLISNDSSAIYNLTLKIVFNQKAKILNVISSDSNISPIIKGNSARFTINNFEKQQSFNLDFFVSNNFSESLKVSSNIANLEFKRIEKLCVKKIVVKKKKSLIIKKIFSFEDHPLLAQILGGFFGGLLLTVVLALFTIFSSHPKEVNNNPIKIDSLNKPKTDSITLFPTNIEKPQSEVKRKNLKQ